MLNDASSKTVCGDYLDSDAESWILDAGRPFLGDIGYWMLVVAERRLRFIGDT